DGAAELLARLAARARAQGQSGSRGGQVAAVRGADERALGADELSAVALREHRLGRQLALVRGRQFSDQSARGAGSVGVRELSFGGLAAEPGRPVILQLRIADSDAGAN